MNLFSLDDMLSIIIKDSVFKYIACHSFNLVEQLVGPSLLEYFMRDLAFQRVDSQQEHI